MRRLLAVSVLALLLSAVAAGPASASFGLKDVGVTFTNQNGSAATQAGSHPFAITTTLDMNTTIVPDGAEDPVTSEPVDGEVPEGELRNLAVVQAAGLVGDQTAMPRCTTADFNTRFEGYSSCPDSTAVGVAAVKAEFNVFPVGTDASLHLPIYNLVPPPGVAAEFGFVAANVPVTFDIVVSEAPPYNLVARLTNIPQALLFYGSEVTLWGNPADPAHDPLRGQCVGSPVEPTASPISKCSHGVESAGAKPLLTLPRSCQGPLTTGFSGTAWNTGEQTALAATIHEITGCGKLSFGPTIAAQPTTKAAESPTGLDFSLDAPDEGLTNPTGIAKSDIEGAEVTLPKGFTTNPSIAEGLNVCSEADLARETVSSAPGAGCPNEAKIGTVEVETPLLGESLHGSLYIAKPYENPFHTLLALYIVIKSQALGIVVKQPLKVEPDPVTGQLTTVADQLPQLPFAHFRLHFREGTRSPLASPPLCGTYSASGLLTPWSGGAPAPASSAFSIISGPNGGACPSGGVPPFHPDLVAGTLNNAAGRYSPFYLRLDRSDSEQEFTHFSIKLPPGLVGKLAGIPFCSDQAIAAARARTGPHGGQEELEHPSCPAASEVGHTLVGAGVGPSLAYAPGKIYLAGSYHGSALSFVAITAAKVGPFDLGTVVVRDALKINPDTAEVFVDAAGTDPIPHIIKGIPVHARDIRVYVDRPRFVLNPTSCARTSTASTVLGSGLDFGSDSDDQPVTVASPFQAADCASLDFAPKLSLRLKGGTKRGDTPKLKAVLTFPKGAQANIKTAQVTLPHSEFLEQAHIKTICTRVQFAAGAGNGAECPAASVYGHAKAVTPLLSAPLTGPVYLRSSSHNLPDLVAALHNGEIDINLDGRIDSVKGGRIRNTFESVPDAPVTSFTLEMQGGEKGLLVNSTDICARPNRAIAAFTGQNGKRHNFHPVLKADCGKKAKKKHRRHRLLSAW
ncbi:MAG TPA: hypothetical protein VHU86_11185 [Solirubrobacterales bacterium]|jgi:hypothetical protein|nr:hypothetical protein [Solirubrobacterales bacterium]